MPDLNYRLIVPPTVEPVSLALAKAQLRVDIQDDDYLIGSLISTAREYCENFTKRAFYTQTWRLSRNNFPFGDYRSTVPIDQRSPWNYSAYWNDLAIRLPRPSTVNVNSLKYLDAAGTQLTLDPTFYFVDYTSEPCRIVPSAGTTWPVTQYYQPGAIQIEYTAGSYVNTTTENVAVTPTGQFTGVLAHDVISIATVVDTDGNPLEYTASPVLNDQTDPTGKTQLTFGAAVPDNTAVVTYQAGTCPKTIVHAILLIIGHLYEHREENSEITLKTLPLGVRSFLMQYKFENFGNYGGGY